MRVFTFLTGKLHRVFDESLDIFTEQQQVSYSVRQVVLPSQQFDVSLCVQNNPQLSNMEFGRRLAVERELEKTPYFALPNACEYVHVSVHVSYTSDFHIRTHL